MAQLGSCIDKFEIHFFEVLTRSLNEPRFPKEKESLFGSNAASLENNKIISDDTIMRETTHGSNIFFSQIGFGGSIIFSAVSFTLTNSIDFLVEFGSVEVSRLSSAGNSP